MMRTALAVMMLVGCACTPAVKTVLEVQEMTAQDLRPVLHSAPPVLILDIRDKQEYAAGHVHGAWLVRREDLDLGTAFLGTDRERRIIVVCNNGLRSLLAASVVQSQGFRRVFSLAGGTQGWKDLGFDLETGASRELVAPGTSAPTRTVSVVEQTAAVISSCFLKPTSMLLTLVLLRFLLRVRSQALRRIRLGLFCFLAGETACMLNFLFVGGNSVLLDVLHGTGMVLMGIFVPWGLVQIMEERVMGFANPEACCTMQKLCGHCWKREAVSCVLQRFYLAVTVSLAILSVLPLTQPLMQREAIAQIFGTPVRWSYLLELQLVDFRVFPALGLLCFLESFVELLGGPRSVHKAHPWFFAGLGFTGFSLFRFFLLESTRRAFTWSFFWEEATVLLAVLAIGIFLWMFRTQLGIIPKPAGKLQTGE